ncbi:MAG: HDOD domain-containing protein [Actinomycetota bacterium]
MKLFKRKTEDRIEAVSGVLDGYELPTFPAVINEALAMLSDPSSDMRQLADTLALDPGITAKLLAMANSAAAGLRNPVNDLRQVVALLGRNQIESILISAAVRTSLPEVRSPVFESKRFWRGAAERAVVAAAVSSRIQPASRSEAFSAALLQDMALPVLLDEVDGYEDLLKRWYEGEIPDLAQAEVDTFGFEHGAVAGLMGARWGFPPTLLAALTEHHDGLDTDVMIWARLVASWNEADGVASRERLLADAATLPQLAGIDAEEIVDEALADVGDVASMFD